MLGEQAVENIANPVKAYHVRVRLGTALPEPGRLPRKGTRTERRIAAVAAVVVLIFLIVVGVSRFGSLTSPDEFSPFDDDVIQPPDRPSIAAHTAVGRQEQAQTQVEALIKADPGFSLEEFANMFAETDLELLENAGVPK